jgi:hypothetical protein
MAPVAVEVEFIAPVSTMDSVVPSIARGTYTDAEKLLV